MNRPGSGRPGLSLEGRPVEAVFFDLDGTLTDYEAGVDAALETVYRELVPGELRVRLGPADFRRRYWSLFDAEEAAAAARAPRPAGLARADRFARLLETLGCANAALARRLGELYGEERARSARPRPGVLAGLASLSGRLRIGLITQGASRTQRLQIERAHLAGWLDETVITEEVGLRKPDPALFALAAGRLGVALGATVMAGDRPDWDLAPARAAGMLTIFVRGSGRYAAQARDYPAECRLEVEEAGDILDLLAESGPGRGAPR